MLALATVFALLVQVLVPTIVMAGPRGPNGEMMLCAPMGPQSDTSGDPAPDGGGAGGSCDHCVSATPGATPPASTTASAPVLYAALAERIPAASGMPVPGRGLAAPPPPSRGPPSLLI